VQISMQIWWKLWNEPTSEMREVSVTIEFYFGHMQGLDRQVKKFAQQRLADALFLEDLGVDVAGLLAAFKLILLEWEQVSINSTASIRICTLEFKLVLSIIPQLE
jgi:hypothetical protein